jgi:hypothetical protein
MPRGPDTSPTETPSAPAHPAPRGPDRRHNVVDQRSTGAHTGLERRRGVGRRLSDFNKAAEEGNLTSEQFLFLMAIENFKKANTKLYPTWTDVLEVVRLLGYRKTMPMELTLTSAEDWREPADAPSNVRTQKQLERDARARREAA